MLQADPATLFELKSRLLVDGVAVGATPAGPWKERTEHLYRHDGGSSPPFRYPQEIVLGPVRSSQTTVVNVRYNSASPWRLEPTGNGGFSLEGPDMARTDVRAVERPAFYGCRLPDETELSRVVQLLGMDALGVVPNNACAYFADADQCWFCEIEATYRDVGASPRMRKSVQTMVAALSIAIREPTARHLVMTAGNLRKNDRMAASYCDILRGLPDGPDGRRLYRFGSIMAPESFHMIDQLRASGLDGVGFNLEFYRPAQFQRLAPGKAKYGRKRLLEALEYAVAGFGAGNVYTNLVFGLQTWQSPHNAVSFDAEVDACLEATEDLLSRNILPLFTLYHWAGTNSIGPVRLDAGAVVDFHRRYARRVAESNVVPPGRTGVLFNVCTISNHVYNDAYGALAARAGGPGPASVLPGR